jgi:uncharacterized protein YprB with RNaseH-like and TPR domain
MDLTRLRDIVRASRVPTVPPRRELTYEPLDAEGQPVDVRQHGLPNLDGASWFDTPHGSVVAVDAEYPAEFLHGRVPVEDMAVWDRRTLHLVNGRPLAARSAAVSEVAVVPHGDATDDAGSAWARSPIFFDLETTGLSGGAGTVPFLVGCGWFDNGAFRTRQFFLQGLAAERALLHAVTSFLEAVPLLVTYNGRTFDVPIMETRWLFHRMPFGLDTVPHLDMLPPARRLWRAAAEHAATTCRLVALEQLLCGVVRIGDVPGFEIPQRYFEYVRHGDGRLLEPVLYHNRMDLLSLAALVARAQRLVRDGADAVCDPAECLALGRFLERRGDRVEAERCYRRALVDIAASAAQQQEALHALALLLRRSRRYREAAETWQQVLAQGIGRTVAVREAVEALAIHHEHRERDLQRARGLALRALSSERDPRRREAVRYRLARLDRKLAQSRPPIHQPLLIAADPAEL